MMYKSVKRLSNMVVLDLDDVEAEHRGLMRAFRLVAVVAFVACHTTAKVELPGDEEGTDPVTDDMSTGATGSSGDTAQTGDTGQTGETGATGPAPPVDVPFGLDARPSNATCAARPPPVQRGLVQQQIFTNNGGLGLNDLVMAVEQRTIDGARIWFVAQRNGIVRAFQETAPQSGLIALNGGTKRLHTIIDIGPRVHDGSNAQPGESGLLGMALDPAYETNHRIYLAFAAPNGAVGCPAKNTGGFSGEPSGNPTCSTVSRFEVAPVINAGMLDGFTPSAASVVETLVPLNGAMSPEFIRHPDDNHNGGAILFDAQGRLLASFGDGGGGGDTYCNGKNPSSMLAKIHRFDVSCATMPCPLPSDNPFAGSSIYARGFRNPWRMSLDRATGDVWVSDVGQDTWEEVDKLVAGGHFGWSAFEADATYSNGCAGTVTSPVDPVVKYFNDGSRTSVTNAYVYRGSAMPEYASWLVFGDFATQEVWAVPPPFTQLVDVSSQATIFDAGSYGLTLYTDEDDELYAAYGNTLRRLLPTGPTGPAFPTKLSETGCMNATSPSQPATGLVPYGLNVPLWSDGAAKERWMAIPDGQQVVIGPTGDFQFPVGTVLVKQFSLGGALLETRLLMQHAADQWAGYTYVWNDAQSEAFLLDGALDEARGAQIWHFPSRGQCMQCHTSVAGFSLGPERAQLDGSFVYPGNKRAPQLDTLEHIGIIAAPSGTVPPLSMTTGTAEQKARAYLHSNCSQCHRPGGPTPAAIDLRYDTPLASTGLCATATRGNVGLGGSPKIVAPGMSAQSVLFVRMTTQQYRMPPLGTNVVDPQGTALVQQWIDAMTTCP